MKVFPPIWCREKNCTKCNIQECNEKTLALLKPYRDVHTPFDKKPFFEVNSFAVYFGFCPKLAKFFFEFPTISPIPVVYSNFINITSGFPTTKPIQRILLDVLVHSGPGELTDEIFKYRGLYFTNAMAVTSRYVLTVGDKEEEYIFKFEEKEEFKQKMMELGKRLIESSEKFPPTNKKDNCIICFLNKTCKHSKI